MRCDGLDPGRFAFPQSEARKQERKVRSGSLRPCVLRRPLVPTKLHTRLVGFLGSGQRVGKSERMILILALGVKKLIRPIATAIRIMI